MQVNRFNCNIASFMMGQLFNSRTNSVAKVLDIYLEGGFRQSEATETIPVTNPATQEVLVEAPVTTLAEVDRAVNNLERFNIFFQ